MSVVGFEIIGIDRRTLGRVRMVKGVRGLGSFTIERILRLMKSAAVSFASLLTSISSNVARNCNPPLGNAATVSR